MAAQFLPGRDPSAAHCEEPANHSSRPSPNNEGQQKLRLTQWLKDQGMQIDQVEVKRSLAAPGAGLGLFTATSASSQALRRCSTAGGRRWWWPFGGTPSLNTQHPLATFPLTCAITASNILQEPSLGKGYSWMLDKGLVDQRTVIMAYLVIERLKGEASRIAPWIDMLPKTFGTPLMFSEEQLEELRGTPLYRAQAVVRSRLQELWTRMQPALSSLLEGQPGVSRQATFEDLMWAYSVFWSRGQSLPVPTRSGAASRLLAEDPKADAHALLEVQEGIVPGLDFCNHHATAPKCWWEVVVPATPPPSTGRQAGPGAGRQPEEDPGSSSSSSGSGSPGLPQVQLRLHAGARVQPGEELLISYGEKSNEELLMLYGFAVPGNPHDHIMLHCPLPPVAEWDRAMHMRMELISALRYDLQFFLPSVPLAGKSGPTPARLPPGVLDTLEVFVMSVKEVAEALKSAKAGERGQAADGATGNRLAQAPVNVQRLKQLRGSMALDELKVADQRLGLRMGALATLVKMLEVRVEEQEGDEGTGTLERDMQLLQKAGRGSSDSSEAQRHACIVYRCEQKRITREYLRMARSELQDILAVMQDIGDSIKQRAA